MFRSLSRIAVAFALVLAFLLSTVPAQAQPRDPGSSAALDASWFEAALGWLADLLGGGSEGLQSMTTNGKKDTSTVRTGPCLDPWGCPAG
jgi:hypothetical protein